MLKKLFEERLYIRVAKNRFEIEKISGGPASEVISPPEPFSSSRLLVSEFSLAEYYLSEGIKKVLPKKMIKGSPAVLIHPVEMTEGGLSEVEVRVLRELGFGAGAHRVVLWEGGGLTLEQAAEKLENT